MSIILKEIPGIRCGRTIVEIKEPGDWMGEDNYHVFIGGCGYGRCKTLDEAVMLARTEVINKWEREIERSKWEVEQLEKQLVELKKVWKGKLQK